MLFRCLLFATTILCAEQKRVEVAAIFMEGVERHTAMLKRHGIDANVVPVNFGQFPGIERKHTRFHKLLRKFSLDFPSKITVPDEIAKIVFFNISVHERRDLNLSKLPKEKLVLFMWEPPTILRKMYGKNVHSRFSRVYTWDDSLVDNKTYFKFFYPVLHPMVEDIPSFEEKKLCTLVGTNIDSKYPNSLYPERKKVIEFFESKNEEGFEFYGREWDPKQYKSYRGSIPAGKKLDTIKNYRFSICYENTRDLNGYITEKIFDCFAAGSVPIYWGAYNVADFIPADCFIDRRDFSTLDDLYLFLKNMSRQEYEGYISRIRAFLQSEKASLFSQENYEKIFADAVKL